MDLFYLFKDNEFVKNLKTVTPAPYLIRGGNDKNGEVTTFYETIKDNNCEFCYLIKELRDWELLIPKFLNPLIQKLKKHNCLAISKSLPPSL
jgi:hypothetical protein